MVLPKQGTNLAPIGGESQHTYMQNQQSHQKRDSNLFKSQTLKLESNLLSLA